MRPVLFEFAGWSVPAYGTTLVAVFFAGLACLFAATRSSGLRPLQILDLATIVASAIFGWIVLQLAAKALGLRSGITFNTLPVLALGSLGFLAYFRRRRLPAEGLFDIVAPIAIGGIAVQYAVGTFLAGTAHGTPTSTGLDLMFAPGSAAFRAYGGRPVFPLQLVIGAGFAAIAVAAWRLRGTFRDGAVALGAFIAAGLWYLATSPLRGNTTSLLRGESPRLSEVVAIGVVLFSAFMLMRLVRASPAPSSQS